MFGSIRIFVSLRLPVIFWIYRHLVFYISIQFSNAAADKMQTILCHYAFCFALPKGQSFCEDKRGISWGLQLRLWRSQALKYIEELNAGCKVHSCYFWRGFEVYGKHELTGSSPQFFSFGFWNTSLVSPTALSDSTYFFRPSFEILYLIFNFIKFLIIFNFLIL